MVVLKKRSKLDVCSEIPRNYLKSGHPDPTKGLKSEVCFDYFSEKSEVGSLDYRDPDHTPPPYFACTIFEGNYCFSNYYLHGLQLNF